MSKSGTLTYQMMYELRDIGFSTAIGIGGDPVIGTTHIDALAAFEADPETEAIVMIGEIGGDAEERAADFIKDNVTKPVVGYVAGFTAPEGKTMGHAGAIVSGSAGTAQAKKEALEAAGVKVGKTPTRDRRAGAASCWSQPVSWREAPRTLRYDVNLSILFTELPLLERPAAAAAAGFDAVEMWWPFAGAGARRRASWTRCARRSTTPAFGSSGSTSTPGDMPGRRPRPALVDPADERRGSAPTSTWPSASPSSWAARCSTRCTATAIEEVDPPGRTSWRSRTWCSRRGRPTASARPW